MSMKIEALRHLHDNWAFLVRASQRKTPIRKLDQPFAVTDSAGQPMRNPDGSVQTITRRCRCSWAAIEHHVKAGGHVLYYRPAAQGLMVLDFDPLIDGWLDSMETRLGSPAYRVFQSSGKWKEGRDGRPAGYGGHAVWAIDPNGQSDVRLFSDQPNGYHFGEAFHFHPGFGFIVWDAVALAETMELESEEWVDPARLHKAHVELAKRDSKGNWVKGAGSRHDAAVEESGRIAYRIDNRNEFETALAGIGERFLASLTPDEIKTRSGEWQRIEARARSIWGDRPILIPPPPGSKSRIFPSRIVKRKDIPQ